MEKYNRIIKKTNAAPEDAGWRPATACERRLRREDEGMNKKSGSFWVYLKKHYVLYLMLLLPILFYLVFCYAPMGGIVIAFQDYKLKRGILGSEWVGLEVFERVLSSSKFWRAFWNTLRLNLLSLLVDFPAPILLALLLNELRNGKIKKSVQTILYLPHFVSWVVIGGMVVQIFASENGLINQLLKSIGLPSIPFLSDPVAWIGTYVGVSVWQSIGWGAIIYISAITGIDQEQYEAARVDGCNRFKMMYKITLPNIFPTIVIMLILKVGGMVSIGLDKPMMLSNPTVTSVAEVLSTYSYTVGMEQGQFNVATAIGLFQSVLNFILVIGANKISDRLGGESVW